MNIAHDETGGGKGGLTASNAASYNTPHGDRMLIEDHRLKAFCLVVEMKSFSRAAARKFMTQSAMSHVIRSLERELGVKLLIRDSRMVKPTKAGSMLYAHAKAILERYRRIDEDISVLTSQLRGNLSMVATRTVANVLLPEVLFSFRKHHPDIAITVDVAKTAQVIQNVTDGSADLGFFDARTPRVPVFPEKIASDEVVLIAPDTSQLRHRTPPSASDLLAETFILPAVGSGLRACADAYFRYVGTTPDNFKAPLTVDDPILIIQMVQSGIGIGFASKRSAMRAFQDGSVAVIETGKKKMSLDYHIVFLPDASLPAKTFVEYLRKFRFFAQA